MVVNLTCALWTPYKVNKHKIALNRDDDKRLVQADGITTLAKGYVVLSA